jgi:uncharacterized protein (TIGR04222 family)
MSPNTSDLLARLLSFSLDEPGAALSFTHRLARDNGWSPEFAARVVGEYKRFVFLAMAAGHPVTPSEEVDQAWHLHLVYTRSYWESMCGELLGRPLHHGPTRGGAAEASKYGDWYAHTLDSYRRLLGTEPPADIWPAAEDRFRVRRWQWVDRSQWWLVPRPSLPSWSSARTAAIMGVVALGLVGCAAAANDGAIRLAGVFVPSLLAAGSLGWWLGRDRSPSPAPGQTLTPLEIALVAGGPRRAAEAAMGSLHVRGVTTTGSSKTHSFVLTRPLTREDPALERSAVGSCEPPYELHVEAVTAMMAGSVSAARRGLEEARMLRRPLDLAKARGLAAAPFVPVLGVCAAVPGDTAAGFLAAVAVTLVAAGLVAATVPWRTRGGGALLRQLRQQHAALSAPSRSRLLTDAETPGLALALFGAQCLPSAGFSHTAAFLKPPPKEESGSGCGSSGCGTGHHDASGCGGDSGCGSSGCGGGD